MNLWLRPTLLSHNSRFQMDFSERLTQLLCHTDYKRHSFWNSCQFPWTLKTGKEAQYFNSYHVSADSYLAVSMGQCCGRKQVWRGGWAEGSIKAEPASKSCRDISIVNTPAIILRLLICLTGTLSLTIRAVISCCYETELLMSRYTGNTNTVIAVVIILFSCPTKLGIYMNTAWWI